MKTDGLYLQYAPDALKSDNVIVGFAVKQNAKALQYASSGFVLAAVKTGGIYVQYAPEALKSDNVIVGFAVKQNAKALQYASSGFVLEAVKTDGLYLQYAPEALKSDSEIVGFAVEQNGSALQYASVSLKNNSAIVLKAVKNAPLGSAIRFCGAKKQQLLRPGRGDVESHCFVLRSRCAKKNTRIRPDGGEADPDAAQYSAIGS